MSHIKIYLNDEPLGAVQKWEEEYFTAGGLLHVTINIERMILDNFSILAYILEGNDVNLTVEIGGQKTRFKALKLRAGSRKFFSEDSIDIELLTLSTAHQDKELDQLKTYLKTLIDTKQSLDNEAADEMEDLSEYLEDDEDTI